jgi:hypothetical protein
MAQQEVLTLGWQETFDRAPILRAFDQDLHDASQRTEGGVVFFGRKEGDVEG